MTEREFDAISRLTAWLREYGYRHTDQFNADMEALLDMVRKYSAMTETMVGCTCHERDGSYSCDYCKSQGIRGHLERTVMQ